MDEKEEVDEKVDKKEEVVLVKVVVMMKAAGHMPVCITAPLDPS